jgi:NTP pyrophosphatase (non-canonical NTP hydrolase)
MLNEYAKFTDSTAVYPDANTGNINEIMYLALGLSGEAGEVGNKVKKFFRDNQTDDLEARKNVISECGDVYWYLTRLIRVLGGSPEDAVRANWAKLQSRLERDTLHGAGDGR